MNAQVVDTNVLLFFLQDDRRLPRRAATLIEDPNRLSLVSMASLWEISIKAGIGKLDFEYATDATFPQRLTELGFHLLPLEWRSIQRSAALPQHHRDPFDRLIVAEAQLRDVPILSTDSQLDEYEITRVAH